MIDTPFFWHGRMAALRLWPTCLQVKKNRTSQGIRGFYSVSSVDRVPKLIRSIPWRWVVDSVCVCALLQESSKEAKGQGAGWDIGSASPWMEREIQCIMIRVLNKLVRSRTLSRWNASSFCRQRCAAWETVTNSPCTFRLLWFVRFRLKA